jgi:hypothetical protein
VDTGSTSAASLITAAVVVVIIAVWDKKRKKNRRAYASLIEKLDSMISAHEKALVRRRLQMFHLDDYGKRSRTLPTARLAVAAAEASFRPVARSIRRAIGGCS